MSAPVDGVLLQAFMRNFWGYGDYTAPIWLIGMEEGGGNSLDEVMRRLQVWDRHGRPDLEDVATFHRDLGMPEYFDDYPRLQQTWARLARIVLRAQCRPSGQGDVRIYQRDRLGRPGGETCLLELLPLPSPGRHTWLYDEFGEIPHLQTREAYENHYVEARARGLYERIEICQPPVVIFYSVGAWHRHWWEVIAGVQFVRRQLATDYVFEGISSRTRFLIIKHPTSHGIPNTYFDEVGELLSAHLLPK